MAVTYNEELWDKKECRKRWDKESNVEPCSEVDTWHCMWDRECSDLPVTVRQRHKTGHLQAVLSDEGYHKTLTQDRGEVGSEADMEGVSWEGNMLGEI